MTARAGGAVVQHESAMKSPKNKNNKQKVGTYRLSDQRNRFWR